MGVEYGLYAKETKRFLWLGKRIEGGFQRSADSIAKFLAANSAGELVIHDDCGDPPHMLNDQWREVDYQTFPGTHCEDAVYKGGSERFQCACGWSDLGSNYPEQYPGAEKRNGVIFIHCPKCSA